MVMDSGGGTVDFQEFVAGLSAFSSRGEREEKLRCKLSSKVSSFGFCGCTCACACLRMKGKENG